MEAQVEALALDIFRAYRTQCHDKRLLVAIAGPPGCGKSTISSHLEDTVNSMLGGHEKAICIGLDGWHYPRAALDKFPDPIEAHWRRGAPFTFDVTSYASFLRQLLLPISESPLKIPFPTFNHTLKDPLWSPCPLQTRHRVVIIEGLYTCLTAPGWVECAALMDLRIWIEVDYKTARRRLVQRNFAAGISESMGESAERVDAVDMLNGEYVRAHRLEPTHVIVSVDE